MTEAEWLAGTDLNAMTTFTTELGRGRNERLLAIAATWRVGHLLDGEYRLLVEASERLADGMGTRAELDALTEPYWQRGEYSADPRDYARSAAVLCTHDGGA